MRTGHRYRQGKSVAPGRFVWTVGTSPQLRARYPPPLSAEIQSISHVQHAGSCGTKLAMRGLFIQRSLEFRLDVQGDTFEQGQAVACTLRVVNRGSEPATLHSPTLSLVLGDLKAVKAKDPAAFEPIAKAELERGLEIAPGAEISMQHIFNLDQNAPIAEKSKSPYLLYGDSDDVTALGQLPLTVTPHKYLRAIFDTLTTVFSFLPKGESSKNGWTSVALKPPDSRSMSFVDQLTLSARFVSDGLEVSFLFSVKKLDASQAKVGVKKAKTEVKQAWSRADLLFGGEYIRQEFVETRVQEALAEVSSGL